MSTKLISCVQIILFLNLIIQVKANSTLWPLISEEFSTTLPVPISSTKPTIIKYDEISKENNLTEFNNLNLKNFNKLNDKKNISSIENSEILSKDLQEYLNKNNLNNSTRFRERKLLSSSNKQFGYKIKQNEIPKNETTHNVDLHTNMTVISGRSVFDDQLKPNSLDSDSFRQSAYDKIKLNNEKFQYQNFFQLYDQMHDVGNDDEDTFENNLQKYPANENNNHRYNLHEQIRPISFSPGDSNYDQKFPSYNKNYFHDNFNNDFLLNHHSYANSFNSNFHTNQKKRIKNLLHKPVSEAFAGKPKPFYVPKYMLEAPQRSHQQTGLGELFIVLGPLVILPLLSSFALSTFTTLYVTKSLVAKPASTTLARHKQLNSKLLKEDEEKNKYFPFNLMSDDSLIYHPFNASLYEKQTTESKNISLTKDLKNLKDDLKNTLKRSKRSIDYSIVLKELDVEQKNSNKNLKKFLKKKTKRWIEKWPKNNEMLSESFWKPVNKKFLKSRSPRNSKIFSNKLYVYRPPKKVYKDRFDKFLSKDSIKKSNETYLNEKKLNYNKLNLNEIQSSKNFHQPSNLIQFAMKDAIDLKRKFDSQHFGHFAASSPSLTFLALNSTLDGSLKVSNNQKEIPKRYSLKINKQSSKESNVNNLLIKRNLISSQFSEQNFNFTTLPSIDYTNFQSPISSKFSLKSNFSQPTTENSIDHNSFNRVLLMNPFHKPIFLKDNNSSILNKDELILKNHQSRARKIDIIKNDTENNIHFQLDNTKKEENDLTPNLDVVQKYLQQTRPDGEYNDEIIATYLTCNGLLNINNQCIQKLVCQYVDKTIEMPDLEKEVASLIIYAILKNKYIDDEFKTSMREAAQFANKNFGQCSIQYQCLRSKPRKR